MRTEILTLNEEYQVSLTCYIQDVEGEFGFSKRPAMIVLPGGGYAVCSDREADPVALAYSAAGYQTFILRYSVKSAAMWPQPLKDYETAYETILSHAEEWGVDPEKICACGFSAGGHLCACAATFAKHKPAAAILVYAPTLQEIADMCQPDMPLPHEHVDGDTCPCFFVAARDDRIVDIHNTLALETALADHNIPFESHIYSFGGHGFSSAKPWVLNNSVTERLPRWLDDSVGWLAETMGTLTWKGFTEPNMAVSVNGDTAPILSLTCTFGHLRKQDDGVQELLEPVFQQMKAISAERGYTYEALCTAMEPVTLREIIEMLDWPEETVLALDRELHGTPNKIG